MCMCMALYQYNGVKVRGGKKILVSGYKANTIRYIGDIR